MIGATGLALAWRYADADEFRGVAERLAERVRPALPAAPGALCPPAGRR